MIKRDEFGIIVQHNADHTEQAARDAAAENFAVTNRGYDFFKDDIHFSVEMANCYKLGWDASSAYHAPQLERIHDLEATEKVYWMNREAIAELKEKNSKLKVAVEGLLDAAKELKYQALREHGTENKAFSHPVYGDIYFNIFQALNQYQTAMAKGGGSNE